MINTIKCVIYYISLISNFIFIYFVSFISLHLLPIHSSEEPREELFSFFQKMCYSKNRFTTDTTFVVKIWRWIRGILFHLAPPLLLRNILWRERSHEGGSWITLRPGTNLTLNLWLLATKTFLSENDETLLHVWVKCRMLSD